MYYTFLMRNNIQIRIDEDTYKGFKLCKKLYREHHPELDKIPISNKKMEFELVLFYLKNTKFEKEFRILTENYKNG